MSSTRRWLSAGVHGSLGQRTTMAEMGGRSSPRLVIVINLYCNYIITIFGINFQAYTIHLNFDYIIIIMSIIIIFQAYAIHLYFDYIITISITIVFNTSARISHRFAACMKRTQGHAGTPPGGNTSETLPVPFPTAQE